MFEPCNRVSGVRRPVISPFSGGDGSRPRAPSSWPRHRARAGAWPVERSELVVRQVVHREAGLAPQQPRHGLESSRRSPRASACCIIDNSTVSARFTDSARVTESSSNQLHTSFADTASTRRGIPAFGAIGEEHRHERPRFHDPRSVHHGPIPSVRVGRDRCSGGVPVSGNSQDTPDCRTTFEARRVGTVALRRRADRKPLTRPDRPALP